MVHHLCDVTQLVGEISAKKVAAGYEWNSTMNPVLFHPDSRYRKDMSKSKKVLTTELVVVVSWSLFCLPSQLA